MEMSKKNYLTANRIVNCSKCNRLVYEFQKCICSDKPCPKCSVYTNAVSPTCSKAWHPVSDTK